MLLHVVYPFLVHLRAFITLVLFLAEPVAWFHGWHHRSTTWVQTEIAMGWIAVKLCSDILGLRGINHTEFDYPDILSSASSRSKVLVLSEMSLQLLDGLPLILVQTIVHPSG